VAAFQVIETKKRLHISVPMIIHGFSKNEQTASNYWTMVFISFGKYLLKSELKLLLKRP
jgi:TatD DNase family protein